MVVSFQDWGKDSKFALNSENLFGLFESFDWGCWCFQRRCLAFWGKWSFTNLIKWNFIFWPSLAWYLQATASTHWASVFATGMLAETALKVCLWMVARLQNALNSAPSSDAAQSFAAPLQTQRRSRFRGSTRLIKPLSNQLHPPFSSRPERLKQLWPSCAQS